MRLLIRAAALTCVYAVCVCVSAGDQAARATPRCKSADGDCSPEAVKDRVLAAFPKVEVAEVLECVYGLNFSCSNLPTEETCLVPTQPGALDEYSVISHSRRTPAAVAGFGRKLKRFFHVISIDAPAQSNLEKVIYADQDRSLAILLSTEGCLHIEEVIQ